MENPILNPTNVFHGTITNQADGTATITGDAVTVPKGVETGGDTTSATFTVGADRKSMDLLSSSSPDFPWPVHFDKLYEPSDTTPPSSALSIGSPQWTDTGSGRLYVTSATPLTVSSSDSDLMNVWYRVYPTGSTPPAYTPVMGNTAMLHVTGPDGPYTVEEYATDDAGNDEAVHQTVVNLDNTPPSDTITEPAATSYTRVDSFTVSYSVSDGSGSGVQSSSAMLDGASVSNNQVISLLYDSLGTHTFTVTSTDNLGNTGSTSVVFTIVVTPQSIEIEVKLFAAAGKISSNFARALLATLKDAASDRAGGDCAESSEDHQAFVNKVMAQTGKGIDRTVAGILIGDANYLIAHCP